MSVRMVHHDPLGERLLGAHVAERAQQHAAGGYARIGSDAGQAEVGDAEAAITVEQEISWLDVTVDDPFGVSMVERLGRLNAQTGDRGEKGSWIFRTGGGEVGDRGGIK